MLGLMLIFTGFFGFLMGCVVYTDTGYFTIYGNARPRSRRSPSTP